jgi:hypothetical protein
MASIQDWFLGQIVTEGEMDQIYTDLNAAERSLAKEAHLGQGPAVSAHRDGGILSGLTVTKDTPTSVSVVAGAARDGNGKRISLPVDAAVSLVNLGDTTEGETVSAVGDGSLTASSITAGEAWLSLFIAYDTHLADTRIDALNNTINFRQTESFHFELMIGTDSAPPAISRPNLADTRVLLCDILLDNSGEIRVISTRDAICNSTYDFNKIGYGPEDTAALFGRRSDWVAIDPDGTLYPLLQTARDTSEPHNHAYHNIRAGSPRDAMQKLIELYATPGTVSKAGGSEVIGGRPVTGKVLSAPGAAAALQMPAGSIHDQLEALYDKVNTLLSRGTDTLTGNLTITGSLAVATITSALSLSSTLSVSGTLTALGALDVHGRLHVLSGGEFVCDDAAVFSSEVTCNSELTVEGPLTHDLNPLVFSPDGTVYLRKCIRDGAAHQFMRTLASGALLQSPRFFEDWLHCGTPVAFGPPEDGWYRDDEATPDTGTFVLVAPGGGVDPSTDPRYPFLSGQYLYVDTDTNPGDFQGIQTRAEWTLGSRPFATAQLGFGAPFSGGGPATGYLSMILDASGGNCAVWIEFLGASSAALLRWIGADGVSHFDATNLLGSITWPGADQQRLQVLTPWIDIVDATHVRAGILTAGGSQVSVTLPSPLEDWDGFANTRTYRLVLRVGNITGNSDSHRMSVYRACVVGKTQLY